jgi:hypothetical protein
MFQEFVAQSPEMVAQGVWVNIRIEFSLSRFDAYADDQPVISLDLREHNGKFPTKVQCMTTRLYWR